MEISYVWVNLRLISVLLHNREIIKDSDIKICSDNISFSLYSAPNSNHLNTNNNNNNNDEEEDYGNYTLTFNIEFANDNDTVFFAHSYPYTYSDLQVCEF